MTEREAEAILRETLDALCYDDCENKCGEWAECDSCDAREAFEVAFEALELMRRGNMSGNQKEIIKQLDESLKQKQVEHPDHYNNGGMECVDEMILVFGKKVVADFCLCNVWKYRYRSPYKGKEMDMAKANWYMETYQKLTNE